MVKLNLYDELHEVDAEKDVVHDDEEDNRDGSLAEVSCLQGNGGSIEENGAHDEPIEESALYTESLIKICE